jgi:hypothetical protein
MGGQCYTGFIVQPGGSDTATFYDCGASTTAELLYQASTDAPNFVAVTTSAASHSFLIPGSGGAKTSSPTSGSNNGEGGGGGTGDGGGGGSGGGLSKSDIIALAVGIPCAFTAIGTIWLCIAKFCKRR